MIIAFVGGVGSGKTLSVVKEIVKSNQKAFTNFKTIGIPNVHRLKYSDIIIKGDKKEKIKDRVNWAYWEDVRKKGDFSIFLDELHNIANSRKSQSTNNILMGMWISQIRKILSDNPKSHIYLISQTARKMDITWRDLIQIIIKCNMVKKGKDVYIKQTWYEGMYNYELGRHSFKTFFKGNPYFKFYNTNELVTFSDVDDGYV